MGSQQSHISACIAIDLGFSNAYGWSDVAMSELVYLLVGFKQSIRIGTLRFSCNTLSDAGLALLVDTDEDVY
jgi:hypothetical protein